MATHFWQNELARLFPNQNSPTTTECIMFEGGFKAGCERKEYQYSIHAIKRTKEAEQKILDLTLENQDLEHTNLTLQHNLFEANAKIQELTNALKVASKNHETDCNWFTGSGTECDCESGRTRQRLSIL